MARRLSLLLALALLVLPIAACGGGAKPSAANPGAAPVKPGEKVTIEYWQYQFDSKVNFMNDLIKEFTAAHPDIEVKQVNYPYDDFNTKVGAAVPAGKGPDVVTLYYGWLPKYIAQGFLQPLPADAFPAAQIEKEFFPAVQAGKINGLYWALPIAIRTLGLYYNTDLMQKYGYANPPKNLEELLAMAQKMTEKDAKGNLTQEGFAFNTKGQGHNWYRTVLTRQFGAQDLSDDRKTVLWGKGDNALKAFTWWVDLDRKYHVGTDDFLVQDDTAFAKGKVAMTIDGSYRLSALNGNKDMAGHYAVAPLPVGPDGKDYTATSYWAHGITRNATGAKLKAASQFLQFITSTEVMKRWTPKIGELPARVEAARDPALAQDPKLKVFLDALPNAYCTFLADESADRQTLMDAVDQVTKNGKEPKAALEEAAAKAQKLYDDFWAQVKS